MRPSVAAVKADSGVIGLQTTNYVETVEPPAGIFKKQRREETQYIVDNPPVLGRSGVGSLTHRALGGDTTPYKNQHEQPHAVFPPSP